MLRRASFSLLVLVLCAWAAPTHAQVGLRGVENSLQITTSPSSVSAGQSVHLTLEGGVYDLSSAFISWSVDGKKVAEGVGVQDINIVAGAIGSQKEVTAQASVDDGVLTASLTISPATLDLIFESDSYVPPFFQGRALPSAGTNVRLQAIPRFIRADGSSVPTGAITFTWRKNNSALPAISGRGRANALIPGPDLFGYDVISVQAVSEDGAFTAESQVRLPSIEPTLMLYEDHPLFGLMFHRGIGTGTYVEEKEMTFMAVPFFAQALSPDDKRLRFAWRVNDRDIVADENRRSAITISAGDGAADASIELSLTHSTNLFLSSVGTWSVRFRSAGGAQNPFLQTR